MAKATTKKPAEKSASGKGADKKSAAAKPAGKGKK